VLELGTCPLVTGRSILYVATECRAIERIGIMQCLHVDSESIELCRAARPGLELL